MPQYDTRRASASFAKTGSTLTLLQLGQLADGAQSGVASREFAGAREWATFRTEAAADVVTAVAVRFSHPGSTTKSRPPLVAHDGPGACFLLMSGGC